MGIQTINPATGAVRYDDVDVRRVMFARRTSRTARRRSARTARLGIRTRRATHRRVVVRTQIVVPASTSRPTRWRSPVLSRDRTLPHRSPHRVQVTEVGRSRSRNRRSSTRIRSPRLRSRATRKRAARRFLAWKAASQLGSPECYPE